MAHAVRDLQERFVEAELARCPFPVRAWTGDAALRRIVAAEVAEDLARIDDPGFAAWFHERIPVDGAVPDDYRPRIVEVAGVVALAGIRFLGADPARPFVELLRAAGPLEDPVVRRLVARRAANAFAVFAPPRVRLFRWEDSARPGGWGARDLRIVAAPIAAVAATPSVERAQEDALEVVPTDAVAWYDDYLEAYADVRARRPEIRDVAAPESRESLESCRDEGMLFELRVDGTWAGVAAVRAASMRGLGGALVVEVLLRTEARGRRLGGVIHRRVAEHLLAHPPAGMPEVAEPCLFGTIGASNVASLRAATAAGRRDLGGWWFLPVAGQDGGGG